MDLPDWNESAILNKSLGAKQKKEWIIFKLEQ